MKKTILAILLFAVFALAENFNTDKGLVTVSKNKYGTEYVLRPSAPLAGLGDVKRIEMNECSDFKTIIITYNDGTVQQYSSDGDKMPTMTIQRDDRFISWENISANKFAKAWRTYSKIFQGYTA